MKNRSGILCKNWGIPKIGDKKSAHQARFHSSPINRLSNLFLVIIAEFGSSELIQIHPNSDFCSIVSQTKASSL
jgi:hypothetical protein